MRNILTNLIISITFTVVGAFAADNSIGTWKLNMEKSKFTPSSPVKSLTSAREASEGGVKVTLTGELPDGTALNGSYAPKYDGKDYPATGAPFDTVAVKQVNANSLTSKMKNTGTKYSTTGRSVISKDGKTMTTTMRALGRMANRSATRWYTTSNSRGMRA